MLGFPNPTQRRALCAFQRSFQTPPRRLREDAQLKPGGYVRVHLHSKRWPVAHTVDWRRRVVHLAEAYLVVDKPPGVQCTPSEDNVLECVPACVERVRSTYRWRPQHIECPRLRNGGL